MSPHRRLSGSSHRHPTQIQEVFLGLAFHLQEKKDPQADHRKLEWSGVMHDGTGIIESEEFCHEWKDTDNEQEKKEEGSKLMRSVLDLVRRIQTTKSTNIRVIAVAAPLPPELEQQRDLEFPAKIWLHVDAIPFIITPATAMFTKLPVPSPTASAGSAISAALKYLHPATHSATTATTDPKDHRVLVDCDRQVNLGSIRGYEDTSSPQLWKRFMALSKLLREKKTSIAFFSATPQGGGVALMRHAMIRLWRHVGLDVKWYVPEGHPLVFDITKRKIHNVLQGVAPEGVEMTDDDKKAFEMWTEQNYETFWQNGAIDANLIVIDDPQLTALIPIIKRKRPDAKIIFRSHIQIQSDLADKTDTPQYRTWNYLYNFIKDVDLFLAHPVKFFVPKNVEEGLPVLYMAPSTDPLDGLNKPYGLASLQYFRQIFNDLSAQQCGIKIDWDRGYVCQIARFDPSKGIEWLLESYLHFKQGLKKLDTPPKDGGPQLIIMGHGSVDDPDGTVIFEKLHDILDSKEYALVKGDVSVVRAPPSDSILGCILQGAWVATQLSTREGFEVKVSEAVNKRVQIIASSAGGIPLQVKHGKNGWIVPTGDVSAVSSLLLDIYTGKARVERTVSPERKLDGDKVDPNSLAEAFARDFEAKMFPVHDEQYAPSEDFFTVGNSARWMILAAKLLGLSPDDIDGLSQEEMDVLDSMKLDQPIAKAGEKGRNVWEMVMAEDMISGEGEIRWEGS